jgi:hypothetical protein
MIGKFDFAALAILAAPACPMMALRVIRRDSPFQVAIGCTADPLGRE